MRGAPDALLWLHASGQHVVIARKGCRHRVCQGLALNPKIRSARRAPDAFLELGGGGQRAVAARERRRDRIGHALQRRRQVRILEGRCRRHQRLLLLRARRRRDPLYLSESRTA